MQTKLSALLILLEVIRNKCNAILQVLFYFTRVIHSETLPTLFHTLTEVIGTPVNPIGQPHFLVTKGLARLLLQNQLFIFHL